MKFFKVAKTEKSEFFADASVSLEQAIARIKSKLFGYDETYKILSRTTDDLAGCSIVRAQAQNSLSIETMIVIESDTHFSVSFIDDLSVKVEEI